jgi:hypothetical protein
LIQEKIEMYKAYKRALQATLLAVLALLLANFSHASGQSGADSDFAVELPKTPVAKTFKGFIAVFNTGDIEKMRQFHKDGGGNPDNADLDKRFYDQSGGLKVHSVKNSADFEIEALVQTKKDATWLSFKMIVAEQQPSAIQTIDVQVASAPKSN